MTIDLALRKLIKSHLDSGKNGRQIYDAFNGTITKRTIYNWINKIKKTGLVKDNKSPGRPRSVRTKQFILKIKRDILKNKKKKSARLIAKEKCCNEKTVRLAIKNDLFLKPYRRIKVSALKTTHITQRKKFATWIRNNFTKESCIKIMFTDEKIFDGWAAQSKK